MNRFEFTLNENKKIMSLWPYKELFKDRLILEIKNHIENTKLRKVNILELGSGYGFLTKDLIINFKNLIAIDIDKDAISYLTQKYPNVKLFCEDAFSYLKKLNNNSLNVIVSSWVLHNFNKKYRLKLLKEVYRVLNKDGLFIFIDKVIDYDNLDLIKNNLIMRIKKSKLDKKLQYKLICHEDVDFSEEFLIYDKEFNELIELIGFKDFKVIIKRKQDKLICFKK